jgi:DNA invertase Pin-like site-specific DNA recombinase
VGVLHALTGPDFNLAAERFGSRVRLRLEFAGRDRSAKTTNQCQSAPAESIQPGIIVFHKRVCSASDSALQRKPVPFTHRALIKRPFLEHNRAMKIALYARVSKRTGTQDTENQLAQLREFARVQGWTVVHEYVDRATGKHSDREQFQKLFRDAAQRRFDLVLFWSLDRFSREGVLETLNHLQRLSAAGVGYRSFTEQYLDSCGIFKDAVLAILAVIAKQERVRLSERTLAGLEKARKQGRIGGRPSLVLDRERIARMDEEGFTMREIAEEMGISAASVCRILKGSKPTKVPVGAL